MGGKSWPIVKGCPKIIHQSERSGMMRCDGAGGEHHQSLIRCTVCQPEPEGSHMV